MDPARIADLKRRIQADPTSIAFAQLAEEYRRARHFDEAVAVCRDGLRRHPGYLSARITLGRALAELGHIGEAEREFEYVLRAAPDNVPALRGLAEIHEKRGKLDRALGFYRRALELARYDPDLDETVRAIADALDGSAKRPADEGLSFEQARKELLDAPSRVPFVPSKTKVDFEQLLESLGYEPDTPAPPIVEAWLSAEPPPPPSPKGSDETGSRTDAPAPAALASPKPFGEGGPPGTDPLAQLERDLREGVRSRREGDSPLRGFSDVERSVPEEGVPHGEFFDPDTIVLAELERWLAAIEKFRIQKASAAVLNSQF